MARCSKNPVCEMGIEPTTERILKNLGGTGGTVSHCKSAWKFLFDLNGTCDYRDRLVKIEQSLPCCGLVTGALTWDSHAAITS
jgi:hypothetical protein